jgi:hypothetical protein
LTLAPGIRRGFVFFRAKANRLAQDHWVGRGVAMNRLDMTLDETELVRGVLQESLTTLDAEIDHTDRRDFKRMLKDRRYLLTSLLERFPPADDAATDRREDLSSH